MEDGSLRDTLTCSLLLTTCDGTRRMGIKHCYDWHFYKRENQWFHLFWCKCGRSMLLSRCPGRMHLIAHRERWAQLTQLFRCSFFFTHCLRRRRRLVFFFFFLFVAWFLMVFVIIIFFCKFIDRSMSIQDLVLPWSSSFSSGSRFIRLLFGNEFSSGSSVSASVVDVVVLLSLKKSSSVHRRLLDGTHPYHRSIRLSRSWSLLFHCWTPASQSQWEPSLLCLWIISMPNPVLPVRLLLI